MSFLGDNIHTLQVSIVNICDKGRYTSDIRHMLEVLEVHLYAYACCATSAHGKSY